MNDPAGSRLPCQPIALRPALRTVVLERAKGPLRNWPFSMPTTTHYRETAMTKLLSALFLAAFVFSAHAAEPAGATAMSADAPASAASGAKQKKAKAARQDKPRGKGDGEEESRTAKADLKSAKRSIKADITK